MLVDIKQKLVSATRDDLPVIDDLVDTLRANLEYCVGMTANMIGLRKTVRYETI